MDINRLFNVEKEEHRLMLRLLDKIEQEITRRNKKSFSTVVRLLEEFCELWNSHELKEDNFFKFLKKRFSSLPVEIMIIRQHRELRSHWEALEQAIRSQDAQQIQGVLDNDGKLLIEKFQEHIKTEERFLEILILQGLIVPKTISLSASNSEERLGHFRFA